MQHNEAEELLARRLTEESEEQSAAEAEAKAAKQLPPRWEIRVQAKHDPIVEETKAYRAIAKEVDARYESVKVEEKIDDKDEGQSR